ncbi:MAG: polysaccharide lyase, partial [Pedobacter sp.]
MKATKIFGCVLAFVSLQSVSYAQYPVIPEAMEKKADSLLKEIEKRSDLQFQRVKAQLELDAKNGKPFIPWAAKPSDLPQAKLPAFPGAEGGGAYSFGGRGGKVYVVNTLADAGPGSLREACEQGGARIVVFNVAGIIKLETPLIIRAPYITIAGQSAPGDGVCIAGESVWINTHDVVIRYMRFRRGATDVTRRDDAIGGNPVGNIMIDHVSASWGLDENMSMYRHVYDPQDGSKPVKLPTVNITIQNSIFSEALDTYNHAFGSTIGGLNSTFMRNLWASNISRNPSVGMYGDFGFANNVVFNWWNRSSDGGDNASFYSFINNYYKPGPITPVNEPIAYRILKPESGRDVNFKNSFGRAYVTGNIVEGNERVTKNNWDGGIQPETKGDKKKLLDSIRTDKPLPMAKISLIDAKSAYTYVLANAGATLPKRDAVDIRIVEQVKTGK